MNECVVSKTFDTEVYIVMGVKIYIYQNIFNEFQMRIIQMGIIPTSFRYGCSLRIWFSNKKLTVGNICAAVVSLQSTNVKFNLDQLYRLNFTCPILNLVFTMFQERIISIDNWLLSFCQLISSDNVTPIQHFSHSVDIPSKMRALRFVSFWHYLSNPYQWTYSANDMECAPNWQLTHMENVKTKLYYHQRSAQMFVWK